MKVQAITSVIPTNALTAQYEVVISIQEKHPAATPRMIKFDVGGGFADPYHWRDAVMMGKLAKKVLDNFAKVYLAVTHGR